MSVSCCKPEDITDICDALRYLVPYVQVKIHEKHPWWSKVAGNFIKVTLLHGPFSHF